jgi:DNA-binding XRE family transcriptional regulator
MNTKARAEVAKTIKELRVKNELSQGELAKAAGIDRKTINRIENGHFSPSLDTFFRICYALSAKPAELVGSIKV